MLKLEKIARTRDINITLTQKKTLFSPYFILAFLIAVSFHVSFALFFHIAPFKIGYQEFTLPPVAVATDLREGEGKKELLASLEDTSTVDIHQLIPRSLEPNLPTLEKVNSGKKYPEFYKHSFSEHNPFYSLEIQRLQANLPTLSPFQDKNSLQIVVSGQLADRKIKRKSIETTIQTSYDTLHLSYQVQVDDKTGQIFWFKFLGSIKDTSALKEAEKLLLGLVFEEIPNQFVSCGFVDIFLTR